MDGTVHATGGGVYQVRLDDGTTVDASLRGRLKRQRRTGDRVVIGDRVVVSEPSDTWVIESVAPRANELVRRGPGGRTPKVVAANLDHVLIVVAARDPDVRPDLVDRLLAVAESCAVHPRLVVNKTDLAGGEKTGVEMAVLYGSVGYEVLLLSAHTHSGLDALERVLCRGTSALIGPSGAGKSSLLNAIDPDLHLRIGELSRKVGRGTHTTVSSRLVPLHCGGWVADTPGFSDVGLWGLEPGDVERCFPEILRCAHSCRFRGCAHRHEPDCAVRRAVDEGDVPESRYRSYLRLLDESRERKAGGR